MRKLLTMLFILLPSCEYIGSKTVYCELNRVTPDGTPIYDAPLVLKFNQMTQTINLSLSQTHRPVLWKEFEFFKTLKNRYYKITRKYEHSPDIIEEINYWKSPSFAITGNVDFGSYTEIKKNFNFYYKEDGEKIKHKKDSVAKMEVTITDAEVYFEVTKTYFEYPTAKAIYKLKEEDVVKKEKSPGFELNRLNSFSTSALLASVIFFILISRIVSLSSASPIDTGSSIEGLYFII